MSHSTPPHKPHDTFHIANPSGSSMTSLPADQKYGWFSSARALELDSVAYYATPDGERVAVTSVSCSTTWSGAYHPNSLLVGPVSHFIERAPCFQFSAHYRDKCNKGIAVKRRDTWTGLYGIYRSRLDALMGRGAESDPN